MAPVKVTTSGLTATLELEAYEDLLKIRTLPDYRFVGAQTVTCDAADLATLGLAPPNLADVAPAPHLFDYQSWVVIRAVERERFAIFADTGLGKTAMQLEWARLVTDRHGGRTLIVAPLNVCRQTIAEAVRFYGDDLVVDDLTDRAALTAWLVDGEGVGITNYEKFDNAVTTDQGDFGNMKYQQGDVWPVGAVVLDESSMLKSFGTRKFAVTRAFDGVRYKLACSATPAPNQRTEFAQHAVFLGQVRSTTEYLTAYFMNRDGDWQFKPHSFDAWIANLTSWAVFVRDPKAWGFADHLSDLPPMRESFEQVPLTVEQMAAAQMYETGDQPSLFGATPGGITSRTKMMQIAHGFELRDGEIVARYPTHKPQWIAELCNERYADEQVIVWVTFDEEGDRLADLIDDAVHLSGKTPIVQRERTVDVFRSGLGFCTCLSAKNGGNTTASGTKPIKSESGNTESAKTSGRSETPPNERSTPRVPKPEREQSHRPRHGEPPTPTPTSPTDSSLTGSLPLSTTPSSPRRGEGAASVVVPTPALAPGGSSSTIATTRAPSEGSSATTATSDSGSSTTTPSDSKGLCATCGSRGRVLILKPSQFGFGVNLQSCRVQVFSTITDSFERYYQCIRRSHRYGQTRAVIVHIPLTQLDEAICQNTMSKQSTFLEDARSLEAAVVARLRPADTSEVTVPDALPMIELAREEGRLWTLIQGDSIAHMPTMEPQSVDLSVFSPPFASLYAYSKALGDMGNVRADAEFRLQWRWFAERLLPLMKPGRVVAIHCKEIIRFANTHGYRHAYDFPSDLREGMVDAGFNYQRRVTIWKNPQLEATRNKETSLLHVTALRDAASSLPQTGEYLMLFTAPGANEVPVIHERSEHTFERHTEWMNSIWQQPALREGEAAMFEAWLDPDGSGGAWTGIRETDVLNAAVAKERPEERHVCPLQLGLIERCVRLWTNPGELVFSPFAGIGSEGWESLRHQRRFYGIELKESYFRTAARNLAQIERVTSGLQSLFDEVS